MDPPKSKTTMRISTNMGTASEYTNSNMSVVEVKGKTPQQKGDHYLQVSLGALKELSNLMKQVHLSETERAAYQEAYDTGMGRYDDMVRLRERLLTQKKSFGSFFLNLFVRESEASRFHKVTYRNLSTIRRTSEELQRRLLPTTVGATLGSLAEGSNVSVCEESPRDVVGGSMLAKDLPPDETLQGLNLEVNSEEEEKEAIALFNQIGTSARGCDDDDDDDGDDSASCATVRPSTSQSRSPSPSLSITIVYNMNNISNSVLSINSEVTGAAVIAGHSGGSE